MNEKFYASKKIKINDLKPYKNNARMHNPSQIDQIAAAIEEFGFTNPILIDDKNNLIAGHGRIEAAKILEMQQVPAIIVTGLSAKKRRALIIADNKLALNASWDTELLEIELKALKDDFGSLMGFSDKELAQFLYDPNSEKPFDDSTNPLIIIECENEKQQMALFGELDDRGLNVRIVD